MKPTLPILVRTRFKTLALTVLPGLFALGTSASAQEPSGSVGVGSNIRWVENPQSCGAYEQGFGATTLSAFKGCTGSIEMGDPLSEMNYIYSTATSIATATVTPGHSLGGSAQLAGWITTGWLNSWGENLESSASAMFYDYIRVAPLSGSLTPEQLGSYYVRMPSWISGVASGYSTAYGGWSSTAYLDVGVGSYARDQWVEYRSSGEYSSSINPGALTVRLADFQDSNWQLPFFANFTVRLYVNAIGGGYPGQHTELFNVLADYASTAHMGIAQVYDEMGNNVSSQFALTTASGRDFNAEASATVTPEPVSIALLGTGLVGLGAVRRRRRKQTAA